MREFNTTGPCVPELHYLVDTTDCVAQMRIMVERDKYVCMNRGRQHGKSTMLIALQRSLSASFACVMLDFRRFSTTDLATEGNFVRGLIRMLSNNSSQLTPRLQKRSTL